ncbi:hypothetical protein [Kitasatospora sp. NPDC056800]|uniref:hypothetical protein n=1 Tax=Kitasatospora sp. NPDC056800 TaxID=3345948 RepID=UPI0036C40BD7
MPKPSPTHLFCVGLGNRARHLPVGIRRRLVVIVVLLIAAAAVALGADVSAVVGAIALPSAAVKLADLAVGSGPGRQRSQPAVQGR